MATNEILTFAQGPGANVLTQSAYSADAQRPIGHQPGTARSQLANKQSLQSSLMASALAQYIADNQSNNVVDTASATDIATWLGNAVRATSTPYADAGGTANTITADFTPNVSFINGQTVLVRAAMANTTTTPTFSADGITPKTIVKGANTALVAGDIAGAGHWLELQADTVLDKWVLQNPAYSISATSPKQIQTIGATVSANALTITLQPTSLDFRSATLGSGSVNTRAVASAISLTVSSGSTLGTANGVASRLVVLAIDNAGTVELAVTNLAGGLNLDETTIVNTSAEGGAGAADSANVIYSQTTRTGVPFRVVGFIDSTQATAGTWATAPSTIQGIGGQALAAMSSLGYGTWQNVTASRVLGTTYYNTTGRPIFVKVGSTGTTSASVTITVGGVTMPAWTVNTSASALANDSVIVPVSASYVITMTTGTLQSWVELR